MTLASSGRWFIALGALSAAASVVIGAGAAHRTGAMTVGALSLFQTALQYHQFHALGLILVGLAEARTAPSRWLVSSGCLMLVGTLLFSGNLYLRSLAGINDFHAVTPFGGGAYILAWIALAIAMVQPREPI